MLGGAASRNSPEMVSRWSEAMADESLATGVGIEILYFINERSEPHKHWSERTFGLDERKANMV
jgi:hypothetical protein